LKIDFREHIVNTNIFIELVSTNIIINSEQDILDLIVDTEYQFDCKNIIVHRKNINEAFFDLKSGFAGAILLKLSNYKIKFGMVGDFSDLDDTFQDLIYESNKTGQTVFSSDVNKVIALWN